MRWVLKIVQGIYLLRTGPKSLKGTVSAPIFYYQSNQTFDIMFMIIIRVLVILKRTDLYSLFVKILSIFAKSDLNLRWEHVISGPQI